MNRKLGALCIIIKRNYCFLFVYLHENNTGRKFEAQDVREKKIELIFAAFRMVFQKIPEQNNAHSEEYCFQKMLNL